MLASNEFHDSSGSSLEGLDTVFLTVLLEPGNDSLEVSLDVGHEVLLGELDLLEFEGVDDVVNHLNLSVVLRLVGIEGSLLVDDDVVILGDVLGLNDIDSVVALTRVADLALYKLVGVGVREHLVSAKGIFKYFHDCCLFISSWMNICFLAQE